MAYVIDAITTAVRHYEAASGMAMTAYRVAIHDDAGNVYPRVELVQRRTAPPPCLGQRLEGNLDQGRRGLVLKHTHILNRKAA